MTVTLDSTTTRIFKAERDPTQDDYTIPLESGGIIEPKNGNFWSNTTTNRLWQCSHVESMVAAFWSEKVDIQEGSFIPVLNFGVASDGITYALNGQSGLYTRIGCMVYINAFLNIDAKGISTGSATITGLPYAARSNINPKGVDVMKAFTGVSSGFNSMSGRINAGESQIRLVETSDDILVGLQNVTDVLFSDNSIIQIDGFYFI